MARRTAPVKLRLYVTPITRWRPSNSTVSMSASTEPGHDLPRCDHDAGAELAEVLEGVVADEHGDQGAWPQPTLTSGARTMGHLDERIGASLTSGALVARALILQEQETLEASSSATNAAPPTGSIKARRSIVPSSVVAAKAVRRS